MIYDLNRIEQPHFMTRIFFGVFHSWAISIHWSEPAKSFLNVTSPDHLFCLRAAKSCRKSIENLIGWVTFSKNGQARVQNEIRIR